MTSTLVCCAAAFALANGGGLDTVMYAGKASEYDVTMLSKGVYEVVDLVAGRNGTDTLRGITYINIGSAKYSVGSLAPRNHACPRCYGDQQAGGQVRHVFGIGVVLGD